MTEYLADCLAKMELYDQKWNTHGTTGLVGGGSKTLDFLQCPSCNMTFKSSLLLDKHREKFCIGGDIGKVRNTQTPRDMLHRLRDYKRKRQEQRKQHDAKERYLVDDLNRKEQRLTRINSEPTDTEKHAVGNLALGPSADGMRKQQLQLRNLSEAHARLMANIVFQNKELEKQKDEIMRRLSAFSEQNNSSKLEALLLQLKAQENKNEILLESMRQQIQILQMESLRTKIQSRHTDTRLHLFQNGSLTRQQIFVPFYGGGSLCSEIRALRMTYLQNGGSDPMILTQLNELLAESQKVEEGGKQKKNQHKEKNRRESNTFRRNLNMELIALEIENQRLEDEILKLQLQRQKEPRFHKVSYYRKEQPGTSPAFLQNKNDHKTKNMKSELELLKNELEIQRLKQNIKTRAARQPFARPPQSALPPLEGLKPQTPGLTKHFLHSSDGLGPAPYDPVAGFTLFYDFLLGLDPSFRVCRLVVGLYTDGQEMGNPSTLPPVYCETGSLATYFSDSKLRNKATLATKQAVPRVRPSISISLIIELQASGGYDPYGHEVSRLISRGWAKIDIFDGHHRVISGRWKIPIRILPIKPSMTSRELNGVPQLENTELYIRLVNSRDADIQSFVPIDPNNAGFYKYPPLAAAWNSSHTDAPHPSYISPHNYLTSHLMYPSFVESVDPPPLSQPVSAPR